MNIKTKSIIFPKEFDSIYLIPLGDTHTGDASALGGSTEEGKLVTKKFRDMVRFIKNTPHAYTFLMGDMFDAVTKTSLGSVYEQEYNLKTAKEFLTAELAPIKDKILGAIDGNHEERILKTVGDSPLNDLCYRLDIDYFPNWCAYLYLQVGESRDGKEKRRPYTYTAYMHHLMGGGSTIGGKFNRVKKLQLMVMADIYCGAHVHLKGATKEKYIIPDIRGKSLSSIQQAYCLTGSFMGYSHYAIKGMYEKPSTGAVRIRLSGDREKGKDIHISI